MLQIEGYFTKGPHVPDRDVGWRRNHQKFENFFEAVRAASILSNAGASKIRLVLVGDDKEEIIFEYDVS